MSKKADIKPTETSEDNIPQELLTGDAWSNPKPKTETVWTEKVSKPTKQILDEVVKQLGVQDTQWFYSEGQYVLAKPIVRVAV